MFHTAKGCYVLAFQFLLLECGPKLRLKIQDLIRDRPSGKFNNFATTKPSRTGVTGIKDNLKITAAYPTLFGEAWANGLLTQLQACGVIV